jgi:hypothetical protein
MSLTDWIPGHRRAAYKTGLVPVLLLSPNTENQTHRGNAPQMLEVVRCKMFTAADLSRASTGSARQPALLASHRKWHVE